MHPQVIGRPSRLDLLRDFINFAQGFPDVWFCTCREASEAFSAMQLSQGAGIPQAAQ